MEGRKGPEPQDDLAVGPGPTRLPRVRRSGGHEGGMDAAVLQDPGFLLGSAAGHHVEGIRAPEHLDVVDRTDGFGVG